MRPVADLDGSRGPAQCAFLPPDGLPAYGRSLAHDPHAVDGHRPKRARAAAGCPEPARSKDAP